MRTDLVSAARLLALSAALAALASCGGGGMGNENSGQAAPVPTVALNAANAQNVGGDVLRASVQTASRNGMFLPADANAAALPRTYVLSRFLADRIARVPQPRQPLAGMQASVVQTQPCTGGGDITIVSDASFVSETFNACSENGVTVNGSLTISAITATQTSFSATTSVDLTFSAAGFADQRFTGTFTVSETGIGGNQLTITISGMDLVLTQGNNVEHLGSFTFSTTIDVSTSGTTDSVSFAYSSTEIGGTVVVTTLTPFQTTPGRLFPHTGAIQIVGVNGSTIRVTVNGDETGATPQVTIQLDANGDGVFELTLNKNWADLV
jgi:hypothetical protein